MSFKFFVCQIFSVRNFSKNVILKIIFKFSVLIYIRLLMTHRLIHYKILILFSRICNDQQRLTRALVLLVPLLALGSMSTSLSAGIHM